MLYRLSDFCEIFFSGIASCVSGMSDSVAIQILTVVSFW